MVFRVTGGAEFELEFNKMENKIKRQFTEAPPYRIVRKGLNLEAVCKNKKCEAFDKKAWVQKGFGHFNIAKEVHKCKCPLCGQGT